MAKKVNLDDFTMIRTLGKGSFGRVRFAEWSKDKKMYAVKYLKKSQVMEAGVVNNVNLEKQLMASISFPLCVCMVGYTADSRFLYIIMEVVCGGELYQHLKKEAPYRFTDQQAKFYGAITASAFAHIHSVGIIHRDLKPENLILNHQGYAKLTDFGFSKKLEPGERTYTLCGTPDYIAPEVLLNKGHGKAFDWWTLGVLIYEMLCGQPPFCAEDNYSTWRKVLSGKAYFPKFMDPNAKKLIKRLCTADLSKRWGNLKDGSDDILKCDWFSDIDFKKLQSFDIPSPYDPGMKDEHDHSLISDIPDSEELPPEIDPGEDPFDNW
eukprot:TRINITY_DN45236_c0_g1_i1.p1 TRINITY_DN45236_c0_g1~~TRINITY_DN45236_c0_g1_i1.p1  ORF type:complete len:322 (-),score=61.02 TRINITY_DN45236_c0_g1_i1:224-1189(-)